MGTGKADPDNHKKEGETDNHPEGTRLGHYVLGMLAIFQNLFRIIFGQLIE